MDKAKRRLTIKEREALLQKYDSESNTRHLTGVIAKVVMLILLSFSFFQLYTGIFGEYTAYIQRTIHLGFALVLIFLLFPISKKANKQKIALYDYMIALLALIVTCYWPIFYETLIQHIGSITTVQMVIGGTATLLVLEATRRALGLPITIIAILFLIYAYFGPLMPGALAHRGLSLQQIIQTMFFTTEGILGTPLQVSSTYVFLFLLFGAFLVQTGVGTYFNDLAISFAGKRTGGPAKVAIFSSALQGTISGSSVANTVTTGSYTIPLMKNVGYHRNFAGAVEAASSTGGQMVPPIMGAAALLMIEFAGVGYWEIAKAAIIPAILYFTGVWIMTHFEAKRMGLLGMSDEEIPRKCVVLKKFYLLFPILLVIWLLFRGFSIEKTALLGILSAIIVSFILKETRMTPRKFITALTSGARIALGVASATACAGIIIGVVTKTGLGLKLGNGLIQMAASIAQNPNMQLILTLIFTMIACLILGMGSPTSANYIITSTIALPGIIALNEQLDVSIPVLAAHMFVFYFGIIADITPPVAIAAFAATGISQGEPVKTGLHASKLAIAAFIIPYMFILQPELLMINTTLLEISWIFMTAIVGMIAIGGGMIGYWYRYLHWEERIFSVIIGFLLIYPERLTDFIGFVLFIVMIVFQFIYKREKRVTS